jgi:hypothetical protein
MVHCGICEARLSCGYQDQWYYRDHVSARDEQQHVVYKLAQWHVVYIYISPPQPLVRAAHARYLVVVMRMWSTSG